MMTPAKTARRDFVIAAVVPMALLFLFYIWIGMVRVFVGDPPSVDYLPPWLKLLDPVVGFPLVFVVPFSVLVCLVLLPFRRWRGPGAMFLLSSVIVFVFVGWVDPGGWFRWFMD
jgi:hypothetical protein